MKKRKQALLPNKVFFNRLSESKKTQKCKKLKTFESKNERQPTNQTNQTNQLTEQEWSIHAVKPTCAIPSKSI